MTIELDDDVADRIQDLLLARSQHLTHIMFHVENNAVYVRLHYREKEEDDTESAPAYEEFALAQ